MLYSLPQHYNKASFYLTLLYIYCIYSNRHAPRIKICLGISDSVMTTAVSPSCDDYFSFDCGNTVCIPMMEVCDGVDDCGNNGDEEVCGE